MWNWCASWPTVVLSLLNLYPEPREKGVIRMPSLPKESPRLEANFHLLLSYVADLELEVDRLRKQGQFLQHEVWETLKLVQQLCEQSSGGRWGCGTGPNPSGGVTTGRDRP